jgi:hypothetical protein
MLLMFNLTCRAVYGCREAELYTGRTATAVCFLGVAVNPGLSPVPAVENRLWLLLISSNSSGKQFLCFSWVNPQLHTDYGIDMLFFPLFSLLPHFVVSDSTVQYNAQSVSLGNNTVPIDQNLLDHHCHTLMISLLCYCTLIFLSLKFVQMLQKF